MNSIEKLVSIAGASLTTEPPSLSSKLVGLAGGNTEDLLSLLWSKNGFYAFESALHVFPSHQSANLLGLSLADWNSDESWRYAYLGDADEGIFFAEDIFGCQFCLKNNSVYSFDPETATFDHIAENLLTWAEKILNDYDALTGYSIAHAWQKKNGSLKDGTRLIPKIPFILGGEYSTDNLWVCESVLAMRQRASIALQTKELMDGEKVKINIS
jgi:hypothetical protein